LVEDLRFLLSLRRGRFDLALYASVDIGCQALQFLNPVEALLEIPDSGFSPVPQTDLGLAVDVLGGLGIGFRLGRRVAFRLFGIIRRGLGLITRRCIGRIRLRLAVAFRLGEPPAGVPWLLLLLLLPEQRHRSVEVEGRTVVRLCAVARRRSGLGIGHVMLCCCPAGRAEQEEESMAEWISAETKPKGGTFVLVYVGGRAPIRLARYWHRNSKEGDAGWFVEPTYSNDKPHQLVPKFWMPLPKSPVLPR
jgi:hypothetical protein